MSYDELNQALEHSANHKANVGYNMPRNSDGSVNVDKTIQMKLAQTQSMVDAYNQYMGDSTSEQREIQNQNQAQKQHMGHSTSPLSQLASAAEQRETQKQAPLASRDLTAAAGSGGGIAPKCTSMLRGVAASGGSDAEVA